MEIYEAVECKCWNCLDKDYFQYRVYLTYSALPEVSTWIDTFEFKGTDKRLARKALRAHAKECGYTLNKISCGY